MVEVRRRENESVSGLLFRFSRKMRRSGVMMEVRKRRFQGRPVTRRRKKISAIYKAQKKQEMARAKKLGLS